MTLIYIYTLPYKIEIYILNLCNLYSYIYIPLFLVIFPFTESVHTTFANSFHLPKGTRRQMFYRVALSLGTERPASL